MPYSILFYFILKRFYRSVLLIALTIKPRTVCRFAESYYNMCLFDVCS